MEVRLRNAFHNGASSRDNRNCVINWSKGEIERGGEQKKNTKPLEGFSKTISEGVPTNQPTNQPGPISSPCRLTPNLILLTSLASLPAHIRIGSLSQAFCCLHARLRSSSGAERLGHMYRSTWLLCGICRAGTSKRSPPAAPLSVAHATKRVT